MQAEDLQTLILAELAIASTHRAITLTVLHLFRELSGSTGRGTAGAGDSAVFPQFTLAKAGKTAQGDLY